jgi:hypothetical protein
VDGLSASDERAVVLETRYEQNILARSGWWRWAFLLGPSDSESRLWTVDAGGTRVPIATSHLSVLCERGGDALCTGFDGTRTRLFGISAAIPMLTPLALIDGRFTPRDGSEDGWVSGWSDQQPIAIDVRTHEAVRVDNIGGRVYSVSVTDNRLITAVSSTPAGSVVRLFALQ